VTARSGPGPTARSSSPSRRTPSLSLFLSFLRAADARMVYPFFVGLGVAAVAVTARAGLEAAKHAKGNPELMRQMNAAAAGFRGMANAFPSLQELMRAGRPGGFEATMSRSEAAKILGVRESAVKKDIQTAHRKIMMLNHPDRGGSPFIAAKINEASEVLSGKAKSSGSAFS
jgi:DnaJ family protein C protein 19